MTVWDEQYKSDFAGTEFFQDAKLLGHPCQNLNGAPRLPRWRFTVTPPSSIRLRQPEKRWRLSRRIE
jgi:hypothetical protein